MHGPLNPEEWYNLNRFTLKLTNFAPPVLSIYLPSYEIADGSKILYDGKETELNAVSNAIASKLKKEKHHAGSVCLFGWSKNGKAIVEYTKISKELPPIYVVHKKPYLKPLRDILEIGYQVILIVMDHKRAKIEVFNGSELVEEISVKSELRGRHSKGGWSQKRFQQNRDLQIKYFFNKVSEQVKSIQKGSIDLILLAGNGLAKKKFFDTMDQDLKEKTYEVDGVSFNTSKKEITKHAISILDKVRKKNEVELLKGLEIPAKEGLVMTDNEEIEKKVEQGAVDTVFLAADYYAVSPKEDSVIRRIISKSKRKGTRIEFVTDPVARKRLHKFGNLVALLRYK
jgi:peptide chain release factor subunit 1